MFDSTKKFNSDCSEFQNLSARFSSNKIVVYKSTHTTRMSIHQTEQAKVNFERKEYNGFMSRATKAYLTKILDNWFMTVRHFNKYDRLVHKMNKKEMVFVTLTLPSTQMHDDNYIKRNILNKFIISCRNTNMFEEYFWRAEKQKNGNIHFHLLIDCYIAKERLQEIWNRCLVKDLYINEFEHKYKHRNPPTTHIQQIPSNQNIIDYVIKYVGKNEGTDKVQGRIWGMSDKLRELKSLILDVDRENEVTISEFVEENNRNVYQDENCMVVMIPFDKRLNYYKRLEKHNIYKVMNVNSKYMYLDGDVPNNILNPVCVKHVSNTIVKQVKTQFQLFEENFYQSKI